MATIPAAASALQALTILTGTVTYLQRAALPRTAVVEVTLADISSANAPAKVISVVTITPTIESRGMTAQEVFEKVKGIIVELLGVDAAKVTPEARFREDLEADSLDLVELIMAFEEEFGEEVPDEDACKLTTVGDVVTYFQNRTLETNGRQVWFPFELKYDPAQIDSRHRYALSARIADGDRLLFVNTNDYPVLTDGSFMNDIEIIVDPVGQ